MKNFDPQLLQFLKKHHIVFDYNEHIPVFTVEESEHIKESIPGAHTKNLFLTDKKGGFYLVTLAAHKRFPVNLFRKQLGTKELSFASAEELYEKLHLTPGSVSLFGLIYDQPASVHVFIDQELRKADQVGRHPNRNDATIIIGHNQLINFLEATGHKIQQITFTEDTVSIDK